MKHLIRSWRANPAFIVIVLGILAVGIGSTTAMFSLVYGVLLRPIPFPDSERIGLIQLASNKFRGSLRQVSLADFEDWKRDARQFEAMAAYRVERFSLLEGSASQSVEYARVTPELFTVLGAKPLLGQLFEPSDDQPGGSSNKVILSHSLWRSRFGSDPGIVGKVLRTSVSSLTVVGVMPEGFRYPDRSELWVPVQSLLQVRRADRQDRGARQFWVIGKLRPGASLDSAQSELDRIGQQLAAAFPVTNEGMRPFLRTLRESTVGNVQPYLWLLFGSVLLVLAICATNAANLFLVRAAARTREFTIRSALGANAGVIIRQQLAECVLISTLGGLLGLVLAKTLIDLFPRFVEGQLPVWLTVTLDWPALAFSSGIALLIGAAFGILPAIMASRVNLNDVLKEGVRGSSGAGQVKKGLVVGQVALAAVLLISAGLMLRSLKNLQRVELGFQARNVTTVQLTPFVPGDEKERIRRSTAYFERVLAKIQELPGVVAAGGTDAFPFTNSYAAGRPAYQMEARGDSRQDAQQRKPSGLIDVTPNYFTAMGIPLLEGRNFRETDDLQAPWVIILSQRAAQALFPGRSALGQQVRTNTAGAVDPWATVIGVVGNVKYRANETDAALEFYYPYKQYGLSTTRLAVRLDQPRAGFDQELRAAINAVDTETPVEEIGTMAALIDETLWQERIWSLLLGAFAAAAFLLALLGLYGVLTFSVSQRTKEIGIRMAIGAQPSRVMRMVIQDGLNLVALGLVLGVASALLLGRWMASLLFQVSWLDPATYVAVVVLIPLAGVLAAAVPAARAVRVDPLRALRSE